MLNRVLYMNREDEIMEIVFILDQAMKEVHLMNICPISPMLHSLITAGRRVICPPYFQQHYMSDKSIPFRVKISMLRLRAIFLLAPMKKNLA